MSKFKFGDKVICIRFEIVPEMHLTNKGMAFKNKIKDTFFNREAIISKTYKEYMDEQFNCNDSEDKDEYEIQFLDDKHTLA